MSEQNQAKVKINNIEIEPLSWQILCHVMEEYGVTEINTGVNLCIYLSHEVLELLKLKHGKSVGNYLAIKNRYQALLAMLKIEYADDFHKIRRKLWEVQ